MSKEQVVNELHRSARKNFKRRHYQMRGINDTFQADLIEMIPYATQNKNYKYILTVIDTFSKFAWAMPLKTKTGKEVTTAMKHIFKSSLRIPKNLHTDQGKEFYNQLFNTLMKQNGINHYSTYSKLKASIAERFNRTLLTNLWKHFSLRGRHEWVNSLDNIIEKYNNTKHRTIKMTPSEVNKNNEQRLLNTVYKENNTYVLNNEYKRDQLKINEPVRISKHKHQFEKGYTPNWTTEIFKICKIQHTTPITYLLKDLDGNEIKGCFYAHELQRVKYPDIFLIEKIIHRKGDKVFVKWLGFNSSHNSWIKKSDLV